MGFYSKIHGCELDWKGLKKEQIVENVLNHMGPGSIVLQHSGTGNGGGLIWNYQGATNDYRKIEGGWIPISHLA